MTGKPMEIAESNKLPAVEGEKKLKPYLKPRLEELGDLRNLTLGPTPGAGESGNPFLLLA
jgi:hypothetical protein